MTVEPAPASPGVVRARRRLTGAVGLLTIANLVNAAGGFITAPLTARALGPAGRGELAAIIAPLALLPGVVSFGIQGYAYRELPRGRRPSEIIGSLALPLLIIGVLVGALGVPIADALAGSRETVRTFLIIGLAATPVVLMTNLLQASLAALERWRGLVATNAIPFMVPLLTIVVLYALGRLTVSAVAAATICGSVLAVLPGLVLLPGARRPVFRGTIARRAVTFGLKAWVGGQALTANLYLDQVLMITLVTPRVLGLYAVAVSIAGASGIATSALAPPLAARVGGGQRELLPQAVRVMLVATAGFDLALALIAPILIPIVFGSRFEPAVWMTVLLLAANVSFAGANTLSAGLQADGRPLIPSAGEGVALVVTVVGLLVLLGPLGGIGAALVSLAAYSTSFLFQLVVASRRLGIPITQFVVPTRADARWAAELLSGLARRVRRAK